jgi:glycosyltransferase 2 family protein
MAAVPESEGARPASSPRRPLHRFGPVHLSVKPSVKLGLRIAISVVLLAVLVTKLPAGDIEPRNSHAGTIAFLVGALLFTFLGFVLSAWRWQRVFAVFHLHVPLRTLLQHYLAGQFVGNVLPSTVGGDVLRISRAAKTTGQSDIAFASVAIERMSGFVALPLLTLVGFAVQPDLLHESNAWMALAIAGATVAGLVVILTLAGSEHLAGRFEQHENWMRFIGAVHVGVDRIRREPAHAVSVLFAALAYQLAVLISVWCAIHALGVSVPNGAILAFLPAVAAAQVLPISLSGLGIREGLLVLLLHPLGVPTGKAIGVGLLWYGMTLLVSFLGAPAFAVGHRERDKIAPGRGDAGAPSGAGRVT